MSIIPSLYHPFCKRLGGTKTALWPLEVPSSGTTKNASGEKTGLASPKTGDAHVLPHPIKEESIEKHIKSVK